VKLLKCGWGARNNRGGYQGHPEPHSMQIMRVSRRIGLFRYGQISQQIRSQNFRRLRLISTGRYQTLLFRQLGSEDVACSSILMVVCPRETFRRSSGIHLMECLDNKYMNFLTASFAPIKIACPDIPHLRHYIESPGIDKSSLIDANLHAILKPPPYYSSKLKSNSLNALLNSSASATSSS